MQAQPPRVVDTVTVGQTPEGIFFSPDGRAVGVMPPTGRYALDGAPAALKLWR